MRANLCRERCKAWAREPTPMVISMRVPFTRINHMVREDFTRLVIGHGKMEPGTWGKMNNKLQEAGQLRREAAVEDLKK